MKTVRSKQPGQLAAEGQITNKRLISGFRELSILFALTAIWIMLSFLSEHFFTVANITNILLQSANIMMISIGLTFILICGQMDLSVGSIEALASTVVAYFMVNQGVPMLLAILIAMLAGGACGLFSGFLVSNFYFPPFIATLSMQNIARGLGLLLSKGQAILGFSDAFKFIGKGKVFDFLPVPVVIYIVFLVLAYIVLKHTKFGVNVFAVGSNEQAAHLSGINTKAIKMAVFTLSGCMAALEGVIMTSRLGTGQSTIGEFDVMDGVASVVIGGTSMRGGTGSITGTLMGVLVISTIRNGLNIMAVNAYWQQVSIGFIIILALLIDQFSKGRK